MLPVSTPIYIFDAGMDAWMATILLVLIMFRLGSVFFHMFGLSRAQENEVRARARDCEGVCDRKGGC